MRRNKLQLEDVTNKQISDAIDLWIHSERDRIILKLKLIDGLTYSQICDKIYTEHNIELSERQLYNIVYKAESTLFKHM